MASTKKKSPRKRVSKSATGTADRSRVFDKLREVLSRHVAGLVVERDKPDDYYVNSGLQRKDGYQIFFGGVRLGKAYVSYHLMPVCMFPDLLDDLSPTLRARMQGKSCFNFKEVDEAAFSELDAVTAKARKALAERAPALIGSP